MTEKKSDGEAPPNIEYNPSSDTGGVQPMFLQGRTYNVRERLIGMTPEERQWRARYLESLNLAPDEPVTPPNYNKELYNPIRRFYRAPMDKVQQSLTPLLGDVGAAFIRYSAAKLVMGVVGVYCAWYYLKYNTRDWTRRSGWLVLQTRPAVYPGSKEFPAYKERVNAKDFHVHGFDKSPI